MTKTHVSCNGPNFLYHLNLQPRTISWKSNSLASLEAINPELVRIGRQRSTNLREKLPGPSDGILLEVVPKGPVPEHLEEGMVVGVLAHVVEVVVLPAGADALLGVAGAAQAAERRVRRRRAEEDRLVLVHPGVGEQQRGVVDGDHRTRRPPRVPLGLEEADVLLADPQGRPHRRHRWRGGGGGGCGCGRWERWREGDLDGGGGGGQNPNFEMREDAKQAARAWRGQHGQQHPPIEEVWQGRQII